MATTRTSCTSGDSARNIESMGITIEAGSHTATTTRTRRVHTRLRRQMLPLLLLATCCRVAQASAANRGTIHSASGNTNGNTGCVFPSHWTGRWFQLGYQSPLAINSTHIEHKGSCLESNNGKYLLYDREESCYRCLSLYEMHPTVLQYKESYCFDRASLEKICGEMNGDFALFSMFRVEPPPAPQPCPFRGAPFVFSYSKNSGECSNPPSRAHSCTHDSRLLLRYQACPDVEATESNVEELVCLATFKEGSVKYLVGKVTQVDRRIDTASYEETYRCFVYQKNHRDGRVTYAVAQSADATCNGLVSVLDKIEGSKTMRFTSVDNQHNRCRFPAWITDHHKWYSLDHKRVYHFSHKNATLKISDESSNQYSSSGNSEDHHQSGGSGDHHHHHQRHNSGGGGGGDPGSASGGSTIGGVNGGSVEMRLVCHSILQAIDNKRVQIVAHVTEGCNSGHVCMTFTRRDAGVVEVQQSAALEDNSDDACQRFDSAATPYVTLITSALQPRPCPHPGRYRVTSHSSSEHRRKKRQKTDDSSMASNGGGGGGGGISINPVSSVNGGGGSIMGPANSGGGSLASNTGGGAGNGGATSTECYSNEYSSLDLGCSAASEEMLVFRSSCNSTAYTCHGSWREHGVNYLIAAPISRKSNEARRLCFVYTQQGGATDNPPGRGGDNDTSQSSGGTMMTSSTSRSRGMTSQRRSSTSSVTSPGGGGGVIMMQLSVLEESCSRDVTPGRTGRAFNLTTNGTCAETNGHSVATRPMLLATIHTMISLLVVFISSCLVR